MTLVALPIAQTAGGFGPEGSILVNPEHIVALYSGTQMHNGNVTPGTWLVMIHGMSYPLAGSVEAIRAILLPQPIPQNIGKVKV